MKKLLVSSMVLCLLWLGQHQAHATLVYQAPKNHSQNLAPPSSHQQKVLRLMKERVDRAYQLSGQRDSFLLLCKSSKGQSKKSLRYASYAYFSSTGQNLETFDTEYEKGFQEGLSLFLKKSQIEQELVCAKLAQ